MSVTPYVEHRLVLRDGLQTYCREYPSASLSQETLPVLCLHGLTRNCRDFEDLAPALASRHRVLAPDLRGRGSSDHDPQWHRYRIDTYVDDTLALLAHFRIDRVIIIGTSLGGLIGMTLGARHPQSLAALVLNDIGPELDPVGMGRIGSSVNEPVSVPDWSAAVERARIGYSAILPEYSSDDWLKFARRIYRETAPAHIERDMDRNIGRALYENRDGPQDFWREFVAIADVPTLCLRGEWSDLLSSETLSAMQRAHHRLQTLTIAHRGHTPTLDEPECRAAIDHFLLMISEVR